MTDKQPEDAGDSAPGDDGRRPRKWVPKAPLPPLPPGTVRLLTGGNPQIPKGDGPAPVAAYIAAMPGWKRAVGERIDALVMRTLPEAQKAVRWNAPFWGLPGRGWLVNLNCTARYVKVAFLTGGRLKPPPPVESKHASVRYLHLHEDEALDEAQFADWLRQAAAADGARMF